MNTRNKLKYNILITGATGFLGSHLVKKLLLSNFINKIFAIKRNSSRLDRLYDVLSNQKFVLFDIEHIQFEDFFNKNSIDIILHCATNYGRNNDSLNNILDANLILPLKLLQHGINYGIKYFINTDTVIPKDANSYSMSKKHFLDWMKFFSLNMYCINVQLEHFYGPCDNKNKFTTMIFDQLSKNVDSIKLTSGNQLRYFIYIDDVVDAFVKIIENIQYFNNQYNEFQVGSDIGMTIKDFCVTVKNILRNNTTFLDFGAIPYRKNELMDCHLDTRNLKKLGWNQNIQIIDGIKKTLMIEGKIK